MLALPRVVALVVGLPILTFLGALAALSGGALVAWLDGGMSPVTFMARLQDAVSLSDFEVGLIKAPCMALLIGAVACTEGLRVAGSVRQSADLVGNSDWRALSAEFNLTDEAREVELVCELRASAGEAWFGAESLRLVELH